MAVYLKSPHELLLMREAGRIVALALAEMKAAIKPGISTYDLDQIAVKVFKQFNVKPAFLGYPPGSEYPFPATITACINEELVHGIPSKDRILQEGDVVTLDTACHYKGYVGDAAVSAGVGQISPAAQHLLEVTEQALYVGIAASQEGKMVSDVGMAVQRYVEEQGYNVIREYTGHGVGLKMHEEPSVPNWWPLTKQEKRANRQLKDHKLRRGMTYALEPMVTTGTVKTLELDDHWTVIMQDGALCAQFEHTIAIVDNEPLILTLP